MPEHDLNKWRRRRFAELLIWNVAGTLFLTLPLWLLLQNRLGTPAALSIAGGFAALLLFMGVVLAGYFAFLRTAS